MGSNSGFFTTMKSRYFPFLWGGIVMVLAMALMFVIAPEQQHYVEVHNIASPEYTLGPIVIYFFSVVVVMAIVLFIIPLKWLAYVFRALFALMFAWGVFIVVVLTINTAAAFALAVVAGIIWIFWARVWLHDLLLLVALAAAGSVFGSLFSPLTFMLFMLIIAVYDVLAVRFGLMVWMADKLSQSSSLPAFVFPKKLKDWLLGLATVRVGELKDTKAEKREYSILGGGDIGFPLMLAGSIFFHSGLGSGILVGFFGLLGLMGAFLAQLLWFKDKPVPALPPIAVFSLIGYLIVRFAM
jgi:presenilin-like A22 family membrane protease